MSTTDDALTPSGSLEEQLLSPAYRVAPGLFWDVARMRGDTGYDVMEPARAPTDGTPSRAGVSTAGISAHGPYVVYHRAVGHAWDSPSTWRAISPSIAIPPRTPRRCD
jgi:hypothetical protein